jgi:hypothetical protein
MIEICSSSPPIMDDTNSNGEGGVHCSVLIKTDSHTHKSGLQCYIYVPQDIFLGIELGT